MTVSDVQMYWSDLTNHPVSCKILSKAPLNTKKCKIQLGYLCLTRDLNHLQKDILIYSGFKFNLF